MDIKVKHSWDDVTIGQYVMLKSMETTDYPELIDKGIFMVDTVYGIDSKNIPYTTFTQLLETLDFFGEHPDEKKKKAKTSYRLNDTVYELDLNYADFTTSQFIDFTNYKKDSDEIGMLSAVIIPKGHTYMDGYDIEKVKSDIEDYLSVTDAMAIINFFRVASTRFMKFILSYLKRKLTKNKKMKMSREQKEQITREIKKLQNIMELSLMS